MELTVYVTTRPDMFKVQDSFFNMIGYGELKNLYKVENYKTSHKSLRLYYPERFLNIVEQHVLVARCKNAGFKNVEIVTHSVYIIQVTHSKNVRIFECDTDDTGFVLSNDIIGMPNDEGLNVI